MNTRPQPPSLILVTVDCLRADHCGFYGYPRPTTPFLDDLSAESLVMPTAVVAGAPTYYSLPSLLASRMPLALGRDVVGLAPGETTLATVLQQSGYATAAFSAANPYISAQFGYNQGFEVFHDFLDFDASNAAPSAPAAAGQRARANQLLRRIAEKCGLSRVYSELYFQYCLRIASAPIKSIDALRKFPSARTIVDQAISWMDSAGTQPFFLWLHLMDPHSPYYPEARAFREFTGTEISPAEARYTNEFWNRSDLTACRLKAKRDSVVKLYDAGIRSVDHHLARLVDHLRNQHLWDNCVFVLTADHGEEFLENGRRYHAPVSMSEELIRVPLMMRIPSFPTRTVPDSVFSHLHLVPTLLEILSIQTPPSFKGRSLWQNLQQGTPWDDPAVAECAYGCTNPLHREARMLPRLLTVRDSRYKMVFRLHPGATEDLYDLKSDASATNSLPGDVGREIRARFVRAALDNMEDAAKGLDTVARLRARLRDCRLELQKHCSKAS